MKVLMFSIITILKCIVAMGQSDSVNIDFQDYFEKDTVSFFIEQNLIFKDVVLTSELDIGITDMNVEILRLQDSSDAIYRIKYGANSKLAELPKLYQETILDLRLVLNGKSFSKKIYLSEGTYIGISRGENANFFIEQSVKPFIYD